MTEQTFAGLGLPDPLLRALTAAGHETPTPIQAQAIPHLLQGRDLLGLAQTGTGKTAAFALPILAALAADPQRAQPRTCRALILAPTRELAAQIADSLAKYGKFVSLSRAVIFGGVGLNPQIKTMSRGVDILVATPGRLLDLLSQDHLRLNRVTHFVLDEADRMLDMGFIRDVRKVLSVLPAKRHNLLFSATMPPDISSLAKDLLRDPVTVTVTPKVVAVERIDQQVYFTSTAGKPGLLARLLEDKAMKRVIVFTRTKHGANRVAEGLVKLKISADAIHGNKSQSAREKALAGFRDGSCRVLVATDLAARGIDVPGVTHVVNFDLPNEPESYVHRIGRTARAGADGAAIAFCDPSEQGYLRAIEKLTRQRLTVAEGAPADVEEPPPHKRQRGAQQRPQQARSGAGRAGNAGGRGRSGGGGNSQPAERRDGPSAAKPARKPDNRRANPAADRTPRRGSGGSFAGGDEAPAFLRGGKR